MFSNIAEFNVNRLRFERPAVITSGLHVVSSRTKTPHETNKAK